MHAFFLSIHFLLLRILISERANWLTHQYNLLPLKLQYCNFDLHNNNSKDSISLCLFLKLCWRVFPREWLTSIPLVWPYCIPVLLLPLERDSELLRERESVLRLRERRWLDGASFDTERGSTSREGEPSLDKKSIPVQSPVSLGEELQWWPEKVGGAQTELADLLSISKHNWLWHCKWPSLSNICLESTRIKFKIDLNISILDHKFPFQDGVKFVSIGAMFSELVAVSSKGELYQWKWNEPEPYRNAQVENLINAITKKQD